MTMVNVPSTIRFAVILSVIIMSRGARDTPLVGLQVACDNLALPRSLVTTALVKFDFCSHPSSSPSSVARDNLASYLFARFPTFIRFNTIGMAMHHREVQCHFLRPSATFSGSDIVPFRWLPQWPINQRPCYFLR